MAQTVRHNQVIAERAGKPLLTSRQVVFALAGLFLLNLLLRGFYLRYDFVTGDEAIRAITATRWLQGARLYADIVTDKPPGTTFFYAAVFALVGRSMIAVHLAAALWNFATSVVLYFFGARFYGRLTGIWAALLFVYFSTNYYTQDMMAANTELLMALPYAASFYFFMKARRPMGGGEKGASWRSWAALLVAGLLTGLAALFKQVAVFNLAFFALYEGVEAYRASRKNLNVRAVMAEAVAALGRLLAVGVGFAAVVIALVLWFQSAGVLAEFWRNVFEMGRLYVRALPRDVWFRFMAGRTLAYVLFNLSLWLLAAFAFVRAIRSKTTDEALARVHTGFSDREADLAVSLWCGVSLVGAFTGGRFFGHYFIQVLPALSLLGARGVRALSEGRTSRKSRAAIALLFVVGLVRFHGRTAILAYESLTGVRTATSERWGMTQREREADVVANRVRGMVEEGESIYIWGYALDVYWRSLCRPAARYLVPYYTTGQFLDGAADGEANEMFWRESSARLVEDLRKVRPRLILDVEANVLSQPSSEVTDFVRDNYRREGQIGPDPKRPFVVYRLKK